MELSEQQKKLKPFLEKFSKQIVYFKNSYENAAIKSIPGEGYFVKFKGEQEFLAKKGSSLVADGKLEINEITKEEYERF